MHELAPVSRNNIKNEPSSRQSILWCFESSLPFSLTVNLVWPLFGQGREGVGRDLHLWLWGRGDSDAPRRHPPHLRSHDGELWTSLPQRWVGAEVKQRRTVNGSKNNKNTDTAKCRPGVSARIDEFSDLVVIIFYFAFIFADWNSAVKMWK